MKHKPPGDCKKKRNSRKYLNKSLLKKINKNTTRKYYYPIYCGWNCKKTPLFNTASEALCFQLVQIFRDSIIYLRSIPDVFKYVGVCLVLSNQKHGLSRRKYVSRSSIEMEYFKQTDFLVWDNNKKWYHKSVVMFCGEELFSLCRNTLKQHPDFQCSSYSIFGAVPSCCVKLGDLTGNSKCVYPHNVIVGAEQHNQFWAIGVSLKNHFFDIKYGKYSIGE